MWYVHGETLKGPHHHGFPRIWEEWQALDCRVEEPPILDVDLDALVPPLVGVLLLYDTLDEHDAFDREVEQSERVRIRMRVLNELD